MKCHVTAAATIDPRITTNTTLSACLNIKHHQPNNSTTAFLSLPLLLLLLQQFALLLNTSLNNNSIIISMATGDIKGNIAQLERALRHLKYPAAVDEVGCVFASAVAVVAPPKSARCTPVYKPSTCSNLLPSKPLAQADVGRSMRLAACVELCAAQVQSTRGRTHPVCRR